jgi:hypothetical protein
MLGLVRTLGASILAALAVAGGAGAFDQGLIPYQPGNPTVNGCPAGSEALALSDLSQYPYHVPFLLDAGGNGDGIVCGKPLAPQEQAARYPDVLVPIVFDFRDDDLKAVG